MTTGVPVDPGPAVLRANPVTAAALHWYQRVLHWRVEFMGDYIMYPLTGGVVAFQVPGVLVVPVLRRLRANGVVGPVLEYHHQHVPSAIVLADSDGSVWPGTTLPVGVRFLCAPTALMLPSGRSGGDVRWLWKPAAGNPWFPSARAVGTVINRVARLSPARPGTR
jgi:hypothetical protein